MHPKFIVFSDVDSTLINAEVIELLAKEAGSLEEVAKITSLAMEGKYDFCESLKKRVSALKGLNAKVLAKIANIIELNPGGEKLIQEIHNKGGIIVAISGGFVEVLEPFAKKYNLDIYFANKLEIIDNILTGKVVGNIVDADFKANKLTELSQKFNIKKEKIFAVGDGANDIKMLSNAGVSFGFRPKEILKQYINYKIDRLDEIIQYLPS